MYGPHTLSAYIQEFRKLARALAKDEPVQTGPEPPLLLSKQMELLPGVLLDSTPAGAMFGDAIEDIPSNSTYLRGDVVTVKFRSACPRNDLFTDGTFALVEQLVDVRKGRWNPAYDDDDLCLRFIWTRPSANSPLSYATIRWAIPETVTAGIYRIKHFGAAKTLFGSVHYFEGTSNTFSVL